MTTFVRVSMGLALAIALAACQKSASNAPASAPPVETNSPPVAAAATPAASGDAADAKAFLDGLYAHYKTSKDNTFAPFDANPFVQLCGHVGQRVAILVGDADPSAPYDTPFAMDIPALETSLATIMEQVV